MSEWPLFFFVSQPIIPPVKNPTINLQKLQFLNILCGWALGSLDNVKTYPISFSQLMIIEECT
jgi:hypothetical protein